MKDPNLRANLLKKNPPLPDDQLPASSEERKIIAELFKSVVDTNNPEFIKEFNQDMAIRSCRGFTVATFLKEKNTLEVAIKKTIVILHQCLEWRVSLKASTICDRTAPRRELFKKRWVNGISGTDNEGRQVWVLHPPNPAIMDEFKGLDLVLNHTMDMEMIARKKMIEGAKLGHPAYKHVVIMDLGQESISLRVLKYMKNNLCFKPKGTDEELNIDEWFYPDVMQTMWIINAPFIFKAIWAIAKPFIHPVTRSKFKICGPDYLEKMHKLGLTKASLPKYMGGTGADPVGYHCKVKVSAGYVEKSQPLRVQAGDVLMWDIEVESRTIEISGSVKTGGKDISLVEKTLLEYNKCVAGKMTMESDGTVEFVFSNESASWYSKIVKYDIRIIEPPNPECFTPLK